MCACINFLSPCIIITTHVQVCNICYKKIHLRGGNCIFLLISSRSLKTVCLQQSLKMDIYVCLITLIPVYLLPQFNTRTQYNLPCTTTRTQTDTLSLSTQSLQASSVLIKFYRSMLEFSLHHQFPFVYSFSKYNFLLKKA